ncbi:MAG TPA: hypothetical protein VFY45_15930, partial [Baekduia sp.]|nr:hypothetical protein [Baekduia sp.]
WSADNAGAAPKASSARRRPYLAAPKPKSTPPSGSGHDAVPRGVAWRAEQHSLHQFAIASDAPEIFGVTDMQFRALRRTELSPLAIARLHGRSPGRVEALATAVLRERAAAGVRGGSMPEVQGRRLLRRQLTQLPRWLDQARYNGPPSTTRGALVAVPRDYASNPAISADGRHVAYEAYRQKLPLAVRFGEIAVMRADVRTGRTDSSRVRWQRSTPLQGAHQ